MTVWRSRWSVPTVLGLALIVSLSLSGSTLATSGPSAESLEEARRTISRDPGQARSLAEKTIESPSATREELLEARVLAAEASAMLSDGAGALRHAEAGLSLASAGSVEAVELRISRGRALDILGRSSEAGIVLDEAVSGARALREPRHLAMALALRGLGRALAGRYDPALADVLEAHGLVGSFQDAQSEVDVLAAVGLTFATLSDPGRALPYLEKALAKVVELGSDQQISVAHYNIALQLQSLKRHEQALASFQRSLTFAERAGDESGAAYARYGIAEASWRLGRVDSVSSMRRAVESFDRLGDEDMRVVTREKLALMLGKAGRLDDALTVLLESRALAEAAGNQRRLPRLQKELAQLFATRKEPGRAYEELSRYLELREKEVADEQSHAVQEARARFETRLKEQENRLLVRDAELNEVLLGRHRLVGALLGGAVLVSLGVAAAFFRLARRNARMRLEIARIANVDELTQLPNRRAILARGREEWQRARRADRPLAVAVVDLDHFKSVNDCYGHAVGDQVLRRFAETCRATLRAYDVCGRTGGEEFLVLLPDTLVSDAVKVLERLLETVRGARWIERPDGATVTVSAGLAATLESEPSLEATLARADAALYRAKAEGRDRIVVAPSPGTVPAAESTQI